MKKNNLAAMILILWPMQALAANSSLFGVPVAPFADVKIADDVVRVTVDLSAGKIEIVNRFTDDVSISQPIDAWPNLRTKRVVAEAVMQQNGTASILLGVECENTATHEWVYAMLLGEQFDLKAPQKQVWSNGSPLIKRKNEGRFHAIAVSFPMNDSIMFTGTSLTLSPSPKQDRIETHIFVSHCPSLIRPTFDGLMRHYVMQPGDFQEQMAHRAPATQSKPK